MPRNKPKLFLAALAYLSVGVACAEWRFQPPIQWEDDTPPPPIYQPKREAERPLVAHDRPQPPNVPPFIYPTYDDKKGDFHEPIPELAPFPDLDTEAIYKVVVNCFPERIPWGLELDLVAGARYTDNSNTVSTFDTAGLSKYYAGLVAKIPLYSASEVNNERRAEYQRRTQLSENTAKLLQGLAAMRRAWREVGIHTRETLRSVERIKQGVADTSEQLDSIQKVAESYSKLDDAKAAIEGARLALYGQCRNEVADQVNEYLKAVIDDFIQRAKMKDPQT